MVGGDPDPAGAAGRGHPPHRTHRRAETGVGNARQHLAHVLARAAPHRVPLRAVAELDQPVVVAETDHRRHRKAQHLLRRAGPDAADHRQEVPVPEGAAEAVAVEEVPDGLVEFGGIRPQRGRRGEPVEAQDLAQHPQEGRAQQVAPLREHAVEVGSAPLQPVGAALDRERHVRGGGLDPQLVEQLDQQRIGPVVEDEEADVHAVAHAVQAHVHRVCVAAEVAARLEQRHTGFGRERPGGGQAGDARADDGDALGHAGGQVVRWREGSVALTLPE